MNEKTIPNWIMWVIVVALIVIPYVFLTGTEFGGADAQAVDIITETLDYEPWFESFWSPPGPEVESFLFALQAAVGAGIICYTFGYWRGSKK